jgi:broad specificity phosphatase PhoE
MILVRHGQSEFNVVYGKTRQDPGIRDPELTKLGREQANEAAQTLQNLDGHTVICSSYRRAIQTATIIAEALGLAINIDPVVGERAAFTCDIGSPSSALAAAWPQLKFDHLAETWWPEGGESEGAVDRRSRAFRRAMQARPDWQGRIVVTHWGFIRALTSHRVENCAIIRFDPHCGHPGGGTVVSALDV